MIGVIKAATSDLLPLLITEASFVDPTLILAGEEWTFSSVSAWRVTRDGVLLYGWSDVSAPDRIQETRGQTIISIAAPSMLMRGDPAFRLSGGEWLEIFSDHAIDPWVLRLPTETFVGSPSDPAWVRED